MQEERQDRYYIPDNLNDKRHFFHIPDRNLIETAVAEGIVFFVVKLLPISDLKIKITVGAIIMILIGTVGIIGIKNESVTEFVITAIKFRGKRKILHYRRCDQVSRGERKESDSEKKQDSKTGDFLKKVEERTAKKIERKMEERNRRNSAQ